jgi:hypothetical protein
MKIINCLWVLILFVIFNLLSGCAKEIKKPISSNIDSDADTTGTAITPEGEVLKSNIFAIQKGFHIARQGDHIYIANSITKEFIRDLGGISKTPFKTVLQDSKYQPVVKKTDSTEVPGGINPAWIAYGQWTGAASTITDFKTTWVVPPAPVANNNQVIYIWNGLADINADNVMQPVLQWGYNFIFGGNSWTLANWYVWTGTDGYLRAAYNISATNVASGTSIQGEVSYNGQHGSDPLSSDYFSSFTGYSSEALGIIEYNQYPNGSSAPNNKPATIAIPRVPVELVAQEVLEAYYCPGGCPGVPARNDYPSTLSVNMSNITLTVNNQPVNMTWTVTSGPYAIFGEHAVPVSNNTSGNGQVDLFFQTCATPIPPQVSTVTWTQATNTLSWSTSTNATSYIVQITSGPNSGKTYTTASTSVPNFFATLGIPGTTGTYTVSVTPGAACGTGAAQFFTFSTCSSPVTAPTGAAWNNSTLTLSWNSEIGATSYEMIIQSGPPGASGSYYYTSGTSIPNFFNAIERSPTPGTYTVNIFAFNACGGGPGTPYETYTFVH